MKTMYMYCINVCVELQLNHKFANDSMMASSNPMSDDHYVLESLPIYLPSKQTVLLFPNEQIKTATPI